MNLLIVVNRLRLDYGQARTIVFSRHHEVLYRNRYPYIRRIKVVDLGFPALDGVLTGLFVQSARRSWKRTTWSNGGVPSYSSRVLHNMRPVCRVRYSLPRGQIRQLTYKQPTPSDPTQYSCTRYTGHGHTLLQCVQESRPIRFFFFFFFRVLQPCHAVARPRSLANAHTSPGLPYLNPHV